MNSQGLIDQKTWLDETS